MPDRQSESKFLHWLWCELNLAVDPNEQKNWRTRKNYWSTHVILLNPNSLPDDWG
jgi:hypothetical protein